MIDNTVYYPDLSMPELQERVHLLYTEGIYGVYLDEEEFNALKRKFADDFNHVLPRNQIIRSEFIIFYGVRFDVVESNPTYSQQEWLNREIVL